MDKDTFKLLGEERDLLAEMQKLQEELFAKKDRYEKILPEIDKWYRENTSWIYRYNNNKFVSKKMHYYSALAELTALVTQVRYESGIITIETERFATSFYLSSSQNQKALLGQVTCTKENL